MTLYALDGEAPRGEGGRFWVAPDAAVIGAVRLGDAASVWFGAVVRGDNEPVRIGAGTNVQDLAVLHSDPGYPLAIGADCTIGHRAILHGCTIGDGTLVGMGAIVLNGAVVGRNCVIGAGALVAEGKVIPDGSLVLGVPGRVVGEASAAQREAGRQGAARYRDKARRFRDGCRPVGPDPVGPDPVGPDPVGPDPV